MSRPRAAASAARSRPSRAFSPRTSRVSRPGAGAYSNATAPPATAPTRNARRMLPAPAPSLFAITKSPAFLPFLPKAKLEDAHLHVEVFLGILLDLFQERLKFQDRFVHVL